MSNAAKTTNKKKFSFHSKKSKLIISLTSVGLVVLVVLAIVLPIILRSKLQPFVIPNLSVPIEEEYALQKYTYDQLDDVKVTVRNDVVKVTERYLPRTTPELLDDSFSLVYNNSTKTLSAIYEQYIGSADESVASVTFNPDYYPEPYYAKSMTSAKAYEFADQAFFNGQSLKSLGVNETDFFTYYKYMLMTQGQHLAHETARRVSATASVSDEIDQDFASWLKKHPMADGQYGAVKGENNAVEKEIILDPIYRSPHTTGLYLPAGEPVTVKVEGLKPGESISINLGTQDSMGWRGSVPDVAAKISAITGGLTWNQVKYENSTSDYFFKQADVVTAGGKFFECNSGDSTPFLQSQWKRQNARAPWIQCAITLTENKTYTIGYALGGAIQIGMGNCYSYAKVTIKGAVETPHYVLGETTPAYFDEYLKDAPGVIGILDTENGILTGPTGELGNPKCANMRTVTKDEIDKLAMLWHSFLSVNESFTGGVYNRYNKVNFDWHVPAGAAVALGGYSFAQPAGWFTAAMNYQGLLKSGTWGTLHEIGHNHASSYGTVWGFGTGREGEVRNNALTQLSYIQFLDTGTSVRNGTAGVEHGTYSSPYSTLTQALNIPNATDFDDGSYDYFRCLGMYANIMHSFGADKFYELLYTYKLSSSYASNKRADFAYRCAITYGMNFVDYFNKLYHANIKEQMFTEDQLALMKELPNYNPVSNFYAGGIDGVKTAGDYIVNFGEDITFDLTATTISSLDTADSKGFKIVSVGKPTHGTIKKVGDKWSYSFNSSYTGATDEFSFRVLMNDGVVHDLTIFLRIAYNSGRLTSYEAFDALGRAINDDTWLLVMDKLETLSTTTSNNASSDISRFQTQSGKWEVKSSEFYWKAPKTGEVTFHFKRDDGLKFYFGETFDTIEEQYTLSGDNADWNDKQGEGIKFKVEKDKYYAIKILNINTGGWGYATVGYKYENEDIVAVSSDQVFHPNFPLGQKVEEYVFEPNYMVSKKDNIKLSNAGTDKSLWEVLKAPEIIHEGVDIDAEGEVIPNSRGHYKVTVLDVIKVDDNGNYLDEDGVPILPTDENPNRQPARENFNVVTDYWDYLIDGETGTYMHTAYTGVYTPLSSDNPHEFIIDTKKVQTMNFFKVTTRNNSNSYIKDFELYFAKDKTKDGDFDWELIKTGDRSNYVGTSITLKFDTCQARYIRLVVKETSGGSFSVLSEIDAGVESPTQKLVSVTSSKLFTTKGWKSTAEIDSEPNGYLMAESAKAAAVVKFTGTSVALYARTDSDCGKIKVIVDGAASEVDLHSESRESRKLVYYLDDLKDKEHTMEIITMGNGKVVLNTIGLAYSGSLLNASNIYLERALIISLIVFVLLFMAITAFVLCLLFIPKFRKFMGNNKAINLLDKKLEENKMKRKEKKAAKKDKNSKVDKNAKQAKEVKSTKDSVSEKTAKATSSSSSKSKESENATAKAKSAAQTKNNSSSEVLAKMQNDAKAKTKDAAKENSASVAKKKELTKKNDTSSTLSTSKSSQANKKTSTNGVKKR